MGTRSVEHADLTEFEPSVYRAKFLQQKSYDKLLDTEALGISSGGPWLLQAQREDIDPEFLLTDRRDSLIHASSGSPLCDSLELGTSNRRSQRA